MMIAAVSLLLATATSTEAAGSAGGSSLKYFGWYGSLSADDLAATASTSNLAQVSDAAHAVAAKAAGQDVIMMVTDLFPGLRTESPDFKTKWEPAVPQLKNLLANKTIIGFGLGDELVWGGVTPAVSATDAVTLNSLSYLELTKKFAATALAWQNYVKYASTVRASFPRGSAVIWSNEAAFFNGPSAGWHNGAKKSVSDFTIPKAVDWFSIDLYHMNGKVAGWAQAKVKPWYQRNIYPNLTDSQKVMLVPGAFGSHVNHYPNGTYVCDNDCYDKMCAQDAKDFFSWAQADPRVVAISPWNWAGCPDCNGSRWTPPHTCCMDEIGAKDQKLTRAAWFKIGSKIKAGDV